MWKCQGVKSKEAARKVANYLDKIPHMTYVEPFLGHGNVWRAVKPAEHEILNDISCNQVKMAKARTCEGRKDQTKCERFKEAKVTCNKDYKEIVRRNDKPGILIYLDPPFNPSKTTTTQYENKELDFNEFVDTVKNIKNASVAVSYSNTPDARKELCKATFKCHTIHKQAMGNKTTELLAVKKR